MSWQLSRHVFGISRNTMLPIVSIHSWKDCPGKRGIPTFILHWPDHSAGRRNRCAWVL